MRTTSGLKWLGVALLTGGCAVALMACGGDDDDKDGDGGGEEATGLVAPQLVSPANLSIVDLFKQGGTVPVDFRWTPVAGAASYVVELQGTVSASIITSDPVHRRELPAGDYEWRVRARNAAGASGPASGKSRFNVMRVSLIPAPVVLEPDDGVVQTVFKQGGTVRVYFEWIPVAGADYYVVEINGVQAQVRMGVTVLIRDLGAGVYRWRLWSVDPWGRNGPAIPMRTLTVQPARF